MKRKKKSVPFQMAFVLAKSKLSFNPKLLDRSCRTNKDTPNFLFYRYYTDLSNEDKFMWNKHKFERNRPSIDY
jgi:hypothetical protein